MKILFIFLILIVFFIISLYIWNKIQRRKGNINNTNEVDLFSAEEGCCGQHAVCEKESLINSFTSEIAYFDDEELDRYSGKASDLYSETEAEEFREIFYSIYDEEKPAWIRSLQLRGVSVPDQIKAEIILFVNDLRTK